jgi:hypothetical protein
MTKREICDSKIKHTKLAAEYIANEPERGTTADYYFCDVCKHYHITVTNKKVAKKRNVRLIERETHLANQHKKKRIGFKKKRR